MAQSDQWTMLTGKYDTLPHGTVALLLWPYLQSVPYGARNCSRRQPDPWGTLVLPVTSAPLLA